MRWSGPNQTRELGTVCRGSKRPNAIIVQSSQASAYATGEVLANTDSDRLNRPFMKLEKVLARQNEAKKKQHMAIIVGSESRITLFCSLIRAYI